MDSSFSHRFSRINADQAGIRLDTYLASQIEGWSRALAEVNYLRTGYRMDGMLDVHLVTDADIENKTSFAAKIDAVTDAARPLVLGGAVPRNT